MIAIPVDSKDVGVKSSKLFGNVSMFAIYEPSNDKYTFINNTEAGNGIKTAQLLKTNGVKSVVYSYMGDGPFKRLNSDDIDVYYIGKEPILLNDIVGKVQDNDFIKVDSSNYTKYLDPGTATENCECGCKK